VVAVHRHLLPDRPQHLGQRIAAGPAPQPAPEGGPGFEGKALALEAMAAAQIPPSLLPTTTSISASNFSRLVCFLVVVSS